MRKLCLTLLLAATYLAQPAFAKNPQFTNVEAKGNLESTNKLGCITIEEVKNNYTPADLFKASAECIKNNEYKKSVDLYAAAGAYGHFDKLRVSDQTAHQAVSMLIITHMTPLITARKADMKPYFDKLENPASPEMLSLCSSLKKLGAPDYYPTYMIQHGMGAFAKSATPALVPDFDKNESWDETLTKYLHCAG